MTQCRMQESDLRVYALVVILSAGGGPAVSLQPLIPKWEVAYCCHLLQAPKIRAKSYSMFEIVKNGTLKLHHQAIHKKYPAHTCASIYF